jgi:hypothetical protein
MRDIARHTDLSAELPTVRAHVDVPLEDAWSGISQSRTGPVVRPVWVRLDTPGFGEPGDDADED